MQILLLDIETAPHKVYVWGLFDKFINTERVEESGYVLCWAAKWYPDGEIVGASSSDGHKTMLKGIHRLLNEADVVVHYNGIKFDIPSLNKEFIESDMVPPSPYKQVDLYQVARRRFKFASNKLSWIAKELGLGEKTQHEGFQLWVKAMDGDSDAIDRLAEYNKQDVKLLEALYIKLLPWIEKHPNHGAFTDVQCCPKCGSIKFQRRGYAVSNMSRYLRYQCILCGGWFRGSTNLRPSGEKTGNIT